MHRFRRIFIAIFLTLLSIILLFSAVFAYLIISPLGGKLLVRYFKKQFVVVGLIHIGHYEGTLQNGFTLRDVRIKGLSYLPNAVLLIQEIKVHLPLWNLPHSDLSIFNARLSIPDSDPLVFTGGVFAGQIKGELFGRSLDIHEACRFWAGEDISKNLKGFITKSDFTIQGPLSSPRIDGSFTADDIRYKSVELSNILAKTHLILIPSKQQWKVTGEVSVDSGVANVRKVNLQLAQSKFEFKGDILKPIVDIRLGARVEDMDFHLALKGAADHPVLTVSSDPPMDPQAALQTLFTGNAWSTSTSPFNGVTSSELAENFLDYSLRDMNSDQFGLKTKLTDNLKLGLEMDQIPSPPGETNIYYTRKVNGEMDMNEHMSLNVSQEVLTQDSYPAASYQDAQPQPETQVYLQYKKRF